MLRLSADAAGVRPEGDSRHGSCRTAWTHLRRGWATRHLDTRSLAHGRAQEAATRSGTSNLEHVHTCQEDRRVASLTVESVRCFGREAPWTGAARRLPERKAPCNAEKQARGA